MIIELPNLLDLETAQRLIAYYENNPHMRRTDDAQERFNGTSMALDQVRGELEQPLEVLKTRLLIKAAKFYNLEEVFLDYWSITKWTAGTSMEFHADNVTEDRTPHWYCGWRDYSAVVYLNHDYEGGRTVFKHQNHYVVPTAGTASLFPSTFGYTHGVSEVIGGDRYTLSVWLTRDASQVWIG